MSWGHGPFFYLDWEGQYAEAGEHLSILLPLSVSEVWEHKRKTMDICTIRDSQGQLPAAQWLEKKRLQKEEKEKFGAEFPSTAVYLSRLRITMCSHKLKAERQ